MVDLSDSNTDDGTSTCSRRSVLRASGTAAGVVLTGGVAAAQNETAGGGRPINGTVGGETATEGRITTLAVTLEQENIEGNLTGMWIHVGRPVTPIQASIADQCDIVDWGDQDTLAYGVTLLDRRAEPYEQQTTLYLPRWVEVGPGDLFIINEMVPCRSGYVGIRLEQIGARNVDAGIKPPAVETEVETETETDDPLGAAGPGLS